MVKEYKSVKQEETTTVKFKKKKVVLKDGTARDCTVVA